MRCRTCLKYNGKACELGLAFPCGAYVPHIINPSDKQGDLISRSALLAKIKNQMPQGGGGTISKTIDVCTDVTVELVKEAPAVEAVPVVRCKDCKHWNCYGGENSHKGDCSELVGLESCMYENDFCSYGERKEE